MIQIADAEALERDEPFLVMTIDIFDMESSIEFDVPCPRCEAGTKPVQKAGTVISCPRCFGATFLP